MERYIARGCAAADALLAALLGRKCPVPSRYSRQRGCIANAAPRALHLSEEQLTHLGTSPLFEEIRLEQGFLNFYFSEKWYTLVLEAAWMPSAVVFEGAVPDKHFCAAVEPWDWAFLKAIETPKRGADIALAARQDAENPAWLVRYTARRLRTLEGRCTVRETLTEQERALLRLAAEYPDCTDNEKQLAVWLAALAAAVWESTPQRLSEGVRSCLANVMGACVNKERL